MKPWHFRYARVLVYCGAVVAAALVAISSAWNVPGLGQTLVDARQLYGLWALGLLLAALLLGPLTAVWPRLPLRSPLMYARRAVGVSALAFAILHVSCYLWALARRHWSEFYTPGALWVVGLILGAVALLGMAALGLTSFDRAVKRLGGRKWKRLHRTAYLVLPIVLLHALCVGADFGINRGPDVNASPDAGAAIGFFCVSAVWLILFVLRSRGRAFFQRIPRTRPSP
jgi:sulfoxide reductase heme-binding subunit YedZ